MTAWKRQEEVLRSKRPSGQGTVALWLQSRRLGSTETDRWPRLSLMLQGAGPVQEPIRSCFEAAGPVPGGAPVSGCGSSVGLRSCGVVLSLVGSLFLAKPLAVHLRLATGTTPGHCRSREMVRVLARWSESPGAGRGDEGLGPVSPSSGPS